MSHESSKMNCSRSVSGDPSRAGSSAGTARDEARRRHAGAIAALLALAVAGFSGLAPAGARAQSGGLPQPRSLKTLLAQAGRDRRPIVAMFSIDGCPWCAAIRREQLNGLLREQGDRGIRVVEFNMGNDAPFDDAPKAPAVAGRSAPMREAASPAALARQLGVKVAPTLVFLGPDGEIAERLVGYGSPDFFSAYLDDRIDESRRKLAATRG